MLKLNLKRLLIDDAKRWYKLASAQLAIVAGAVVAGVVADPTIVGQVVSALPAAVVPFAPPVAGVIAAAVPIVARLWRQAPLAKNAEVLDAPIQGAVMTPELVRQIRAVAAQTALETAARPTPL